MTQRGTPVPPTGAGRDREEGAEPVALAVEAAVSAIQRWLTRPDVRRAMATGSQVLSATESWLLRRIAERGPVRMSELARWQNVDRSTMTVQIDRLQQRGLVQRAPDIADRRVVLVSLTDAGRHAHARSREVALTVFQRLLASWSHVEQQQFERLLTRFADGLDHGSGEADPQPPGDRVGVTAPRPAARPTQDREEDR